MEKEKDENDVNDKVQFLMWFESWSDVVLFYCTLLI